jgi:hypothetical protein
VPRSHFCDAIHSILKIIFSPRQARDKHRESTQKERSCVSHRYLAWESVWCNYNQITQRSGEELRRIRTIYRGIGQGLLNAYTTWNPHVPVSRDVVRKTASFLEFFLCLSRACLGKIIVSIYKWLQNAVFRRGCLLRSLRLQLTGHSGRLLIGRGWMGEVVGAIRRRRPPPPLLRWSCRVVRTAGSSTSGWVRRKHIHLFCTMFIYENDRLPRQARDKHREEDST